MGDHQGRLGAVNLGKSVTDHLYSRFRADTDVNKQTKLFKISCYFLGYRRYTSAQERTSRLHKLYANLARPLTATQGMSLVRLYS